MKRTGHQARETRKTEQRYQLATFLNSKKPPEQRESPIVLERVLLYGDEAGQTEQLTFQTVEHLKRAFLLLLEEHDKLCSQVDTAMEMYRQQLKQGRKIQ